MRVHPALCLPLLSLALAAQAPTVVSTSKDRESVRLTLYQGGKAFVQETRILDLPQGKVRVMVEDLASGIDPSTFSLQRADVRQSLGIRFQSFLHAHPTAQQLFLAHEGRTVQVATPKGGGENLEKATLLSAEGGDLVLQFADRVEILGASSPKRVILPPLPGEVPAKPRMDIGMEGQPSGRNHYVMAYLSGEFQWTPSYTAVIQPGEERIDLTAWAMIMNGSCTAFEGAQIDLLAGDVPEGGDSIPSLYRLARGRGPIDFNHHQPPPPPPPRVFPMDAELPSGQSIGEHRVYALREKLSLLPLQSLQVPFLEVQDVKVRKEYRVRQDFEAEDSEAGDAEGQSLVLEASLLFLNGEKEHLGRQLPSGSVRLFQPDEGGVLRFLGASHVPESVSGMEVRLELGPVSDLTAKGRMTDHRILPERNARWSSEEKVFEVLLHNRKDKAHLVHVQCEVPGEWSLVSSSHPGAKEQAHTLGFRVQVPAKGQTRLQYRVRARSAK